MKSGHQADTRLFLKDHLEKAGASGVHKTLNRETGDNFEAVRSLATACKHTVIENPNHHFMISAGDENSESPTMAGDLKLGHSQVGYLGTVSIEQNGKEFHIWDCIYSVQAAFERLYSVELELPKLN